MIRTQIQLTEEQAETLKRLAIRQRISMAALIRQAIDQIFYHGPDKERQANFAKALNAAGKFHSGQCDISVNHLVIRRRDSITHIREDDNIRPTG